MVVLFTDTYPQTNALRQYVNFHVLINKFWSSSEDMIANWNVFRLMTLALFLSLPSWMSHHDMIKWILVVLQLSTSWLCWRIQSNYSELFNGVERSETHCQKKAPIFKKKLTSWLSIDFTFLSVIIMSEFFLYILLMNWLILINRLMDQVKRKI